MKSKPEKYYFEILVTDINGKVVIENPIAFCHNLLSNNKLWIEPKIEGAAVVDVKKEIKIFIKKLDVSEDRSATELRQVFIITVSGKFSQLESFRIPLLKYLKSLGFDSLYVLEDDISLSIAKGLYPHIYKVESF